MKSHTLTLFSLGLTFLLGCQQNGQPRPAAIAQNQTAQGPSDGGGGDTCNGKMIESYAVNVTELPEFKASVQPILDRLVSRDGVLKNSLPFHLTPKIKNWYFVDCKLQEISRERKGLYFET